jgi:hypothetical protein
MALISNYEMANNQYFDTNYSNQLQFQQQQQQQQQHFNSNNSFKQYSPNQIRFLQEIGQGHFGPVYIGETLGSMNNITKVFIKTLKLTNQQHQRSTSNNNSNRSDDLTSTPNINNNNNNNSNNNNAVIINNAEAHFNEQEFYSEINVLSKLRNRNITNLLGVYTKNHSMTDQQNNEEDDASSMLTDSTSQYYHQNVPQSMIFEHLINGDLNEYLLQRASSDNRPMMMMNLNGNGNGFAGSQANLSIDDCGASSIGGISSINYQQQNRVVGEFLFIAQQIASGMEYLAAENFILKDLATRNCLLGDNLTVKISLDLVAQYKDSYSKDYYKFQNKMLPIRWMAPECLAYGRYTTQSDCWSFGVCLWEIFAYGCQPYAGCTNPEAIEMIRDRQLLAQPDECPGRIHDLMLDCWHDNYLQRPSFTEILNRLRNWENYYTFNQQQQLLPLPLNLKYQQSNPNAFQMTASYSSNSQNSKTSSSGLGNTVSTGCSSSTQMMMMMPPPPLVPPPPQQQQQQHLLSNDNPQSLLLMSNQNQLPHHPMLASTPAPPGNSYSSPCKASTNIFASKFNNNPATNSLRLSQRNINGHQLLTNNFSLHQNNYLSNNNYIPNNNGIEHDQYHL